MTSLNRLISTAGKIVFPSLLWNNVSTEKILYLTFDDGPIPEVTPWVLSLLKEYNAKATFFCIGDNVKKHPDVFKRILAEGHCIGNHTFNHLNGWKTPTDIYIENILLADNAIKKYSESKLPPTQAGGKTDKFIANNKLEKSGFNPQRTMEGSQKLFRPPFGKITPIQIKKLENKNYKIVMWDVISEDYDQDKTADSCFKDVKKFSKPGSIVVFHDSLKAYGNLEKVLPAVLKYFSEKGYEFKAL